MESFVHRTIENITLVQNDKVKGLEDEVNLLKNLLSVRRSDLESQQ